MNKIVLKSTGLKWGGLKSSGLK